MVWADPLHNVPGVCSRCFSFLEVHVFSERRVLLPLDLFRTWYVKHWAITRRT